MNSFSAAKPLHLDHFLAPKIGMSVAIAPTNGHETRQPVQDLRAELLMVIPQLRAFARMLCGDKNSAEALSLKTLAEAWRSRFTVGPATHLKAWLFTITRNEFYSNRNDEWRDAPVAATANQNSNVGQIRSADISDTMRALRLLPDRFREALILVSACGFTYEEVAKICDCPIGTVKSRVFRAREALVTNLDMRPVA